MNAEMSRQEKKKSELVFKVGPREKTFPGAARDDLWGANMRDLFSGAKICPLALKAIWMRFRVFCFFFSLRERRTHQRGGVQLNTISKPIKGCIRITAMYLLLWDITLRVLQLQSGGSKFHWLERWGAIETKKKKAKKIKKKTLCAEMKPAHNSHRVEHPRCVVRGWSFKHP